MINPIDYFESLRLESHSFMSLIELPSEPVPLDILLPKLSETIENLKKEIVERYKLLMLSPPQRSNYPATEGFGVGLNSVGVLSDRLSILFIKEWCLRHKSPVDVDRANSVYQKQTLDIMYALVTAKPSKAPMNSKITAYNPEVVNNSWEEAFYGLISTNILIWESQEVLYLKTVSNAEDYFKQYIQWFPELNVRRDLYIQECETKYWLNQ